METKFLSSVQDLSCLKLKTIRIPETHLGVPCHEPLYQKTYRYELRGTDMHYLMEYVHRERLPWVSFFPNSHQTTNEVQTRVALPPSHSRAGGKGSVSHLPLAPKCPVYLPRGSLQRALTTQHLTLPEKLPRRADVERKGTPVTERSQPTGPQSPRIMPSLCHIVPLSA